MQNERPDVCLDQLCQCMMNCYNKVNVTKGYSWGCIGKQPKHDIRKWNQVVHDNGYSFCSYTPFKGVLKYSVNTGDAEIMLEMSAEILKDAYHIECCECHETDRKSMGYVVAADKWYCVRCATRLGLLKWDGKQYILEGD